MHTEVHYIIIFGQQRIHLNHEICAFVSSFVHIYIFIIHRYL